MNRPHYSEHGPTLFLDLDGVFADFDGAFPHFFGFDHREHSDERMWKAINDYGTYFRDMPACPGSLEFFRSVRHLSPLILTACPQDNYADVARQKRDWVREHLGPNVPVLPTAGSKAKPLFMHREGDILVDDFKANVERWRKAGGVGIHHTGDFESTARQLNAALGRSPDWSLRNPEIA